MSNRSTPAQLGYRMPAEWEPHSGTWLTWPHNAETWPGQEMAVVEESYLSIIAALALGESIHLLVNDPTVWESVGTRLQHKNVDLEKIRSYTIPTNDSWIRDYGPNFLVRETDEGKEIALNNWEFDSWGKKYEWELDNLAGNRIARLLNLPTFKLGIVLEGGAVEVNGQGVCLTTESCLLNKNRNGGLLGKEAMEIYLRDYLGVEKIIWLTGGIEGDDTDGHVDNLARFVNPSTILCAFEPDPANKNYRPLQKNLATLCSASDVNGKPFNVVPLPMPGTIGTPAEPLPASYANFYIGNKSVLLPTFGFDRDKEAQALLRKYFPERQVIEIPSRTLIWGLGGVHCLTQQQPM